MPTVLQLRRGTTAEHSTFTGAEGEVTVNTTKDTLVVHDGSTQGGFEIALADLSNTSGVVLTDFSVTDSGGDGSLSYNNTTGVFTYTGPSATEVRAHFTGGTGIDITSGTIAVDSTIATKTYADSAASTAVSAVIDAAPGTLDTLNELAAALGDDANFSTTVTNSIATKLNSSAVSAFGLTLVDDADAATARTTLGLGTAATTASTDYATAAQGATADAALPASSYTASDVLTKIKTVDGAGSGLDADLLDGQSSAHYRIDIYNAAGTLLN